MKTSYIQVRVAPEDVVRWRAAAERSGVSLSDWLRGLAEVALGGEELPVVGVREEPVEISAPQPQPVVSSLKPKRADAFPREKWCAGCQRRGSPSCEQCLKRWRESRPSLGGG